MKYGITGASGTLGRLTTEALLARVDASDVVLITREPGKLDGGGAEVRAGDFTDAASLDFSGIDRLLIISTDTVGSRVDAQKAAIDAAVAAGVQRIVYTSVTNPSHSNPAFVVPDHRETELHLLASGVEYTILRNAIYTEMHLASAPGAIASGTLATNAGGGLAVNVSRLDCADAAAAVLVGDGHANSSTTSPARRRSMPRAWPRSTASSPAGRSRSPSSTTTPGWRRCPRTCPRPSRRPTRRSVARSGSATRASSRPPSATSPATRHARCATCSLRASPADEVARFTVAAEPARSASGPRSGVDDRER